MNKIFNKLINHFINPKQSIFFDIRKIYDIYCFLMITHYYKVYLPKTEFLIKPDFIDLLNLYKIILKRKPKCVVEIGAGCSTWVILSALQKNYLNYNTKQTFFSMEQNQEYLEKMKSFFSDNDLKVLQFIKTNLKIQIINGEKVSICDTLPKIKINFLYEDRADHSETSIAADALLIEEMMPDDYFICVDGMKTTVMFLKKNLKRKYNISKGIFSGTNFEPKN